MPKVIHRPLQIKCCKLCYKYNRKGKNERRREVRIDRTKIMSKPFIFRYKNEPVKNQSCNISKENYDNQSSKKPHIITRNFLIANKRIYISFNTSNNIKSKCTNSWEWAWMDSEVHEKYYGEKNSHKYPSRKNSICNVKSAYAPTFDYITFSCWYMRSFFSTFIGSFLISWRKSIHNDLFIYLIRHCWLFNWKHSKSYREGYKNVAYKYFHRTISVYRSPPMGFFSFGISTSRKRENPVGVYKYALLLQVFLA